MTTVNVTYSSPYNGKLVWTGHWDDQLKVLGEQITFMTTVAQSGVRTARDLSGHRSGC